MMFKEYQKTAKKKGKKPKEMATTQLRGKEIGCLSDSSREKNLGIDSHQQNWDEGNVKISKKKGLSKLIG